MLDSVIKKKKQIEIESRREILKFKSPVKGYEKPKMAYILSHKKFRSICMENEWRMRHNLLNGLIALIN